MKQAAIIFKRKMEKTVSTSKQISPTVPTTHSERDEEWPTFDDCDISQEEKTITSASTQLHVASIHRNQETLPPSLV